MLSWKTGFNKLKFDLISHLADSKTAVTDPDIEGIKYIDEKLDGENNNNDMQSWEVMKTLSEEEESDDVESRDSDEEEEVAPGGLHINRVDVRAAPRQAREGLRVCVEITHPALTLPVYRTWTGTPSAS